MHISEISNMVSKMRIASIVNRLGIPVAVTLKVKKS